MPKFDGYTCVSGRIHLVYQFELPLHVAHGLASKLDSVRFVDLPSQNAALCSVKRNTARGGY